MQKYQPDGALGSSWHSYVHGDVIAPPIQEDETALVLFIFAQYYHLHKDEKLLREFYPTFVAPMANFLASYVRDDSLPKPSYDLWEERLGIHAFTSSSVYGGLMAASKFADVLGKSRVAYNYRHAATEIKESIVRHLWDPIDGMFYRMVRVEEGKVIPDTTLDASSAYGVFSFGVLEPGDERLARAFKKIERDLAVRTKVGGLARYAGDRYYRVGEDVPGNPWFIPVLWLADYKISLAKREKDLTEAKNNLNWVADHALKTGVIGEQMNPYTGESVSAAPLSWSHAQFVITVINYLNKLEELGICVACNPVR